MPVNTASLKTFAPAMRRQLLEAVGRKLDLLLHSQTPDTLSTYARQIAELREQEAENRDQLLERVAYTWFNRLCALRYLDARGWHPFGCRVLMPAGEGETQPELLKLMRAGSLPAELKKHTNEGRLHGLLDGQITTAINGADPQGEVYRELVLASCRSYHHLLPNLFEGLDDATELLLPDDLLTEGSIAGRFLNEISDEDCQDVEIIGWLYQFYISEKKDQVIGKMVKSEDIPAATQLFTPNWIVKYMVQNSLGAQWLATYPASALKGQMEYYIEPAEQTDDVKAQLAAITPEALNPEELTLIDPACGSGHILAEAYELFKAIYLERGYLQREIPQLILEKNLFGLDIDERAAQLTSFALIMKGRGDDRRLFERGIKLNVMALVNSDGLDVEGLANAINLADYGLKLADLLELKQLFEHATTFGSLIQVPDGLAQKLQALRRLSELKGRDMIVAKGLKTLGPLVRQAELLAAQYDAVVANPPYMGSAGMNATLKNYLRQKFFGYEKDLYSVFIVRMTGLAKLHGNIGLMTSFVWMFLVTHEPLRKLLLLKHTLVSLVQLHYDAFADAKVHPCTFVVGNKHSDSYRSSFIRLADFPGVDNQATMTLEAIRNRTCGWLYEKAQDQFANIPGSPIAYWAYDSTSRLFRGTTIGNVVHSQGSLKTGNNPLFVRYFWEVSALHVGQDARWRHHPRGGGFRKWSGNVLEVVDWGEAARRHYRSDHVARIPDNQYWNIAGICWSELTSAITAFREYRPEEIANNKSLTIFPCCDSDRAILLGFLNSKAVRVFLSYLNPTVGMGIGDVTRLPWDKMLVNEITIKRVERLVELSRFDWSSYEFSWGFQALPWLLDTSGATPTLKSRFTAWLARNKGAIDEMKFLEEKINRHFIDGFGLSSELTPDVPLDEVTLTVNPAYRYRGSLMEEEQLTHFRQDSIKELLSYATGCMMGRYSLDHPGLILANAGDTLENYNAKVGKSTGELSFQPDRDGIIPVLDGDWFEDDIVARTREFLAVTFPESTVTENLRFIEESLGKDIRKYFCTEFYKDHLQTYKKRPIYWLVQSPAGPSRGGFACLIYLHRYTKDTLNQVLNNYFRPYLQKLEARQAQLSHDQLNDALPTRERTAARKEAEKITKVLKDCQAWEQDALLPLALQRIELDLDDGVKVNYLKLQDVLAPIPGLAAKED